ncbi:MAG: DUF2059 domain-containing protein, partial [Brevundimonas sp.]|nr:DUF2059 domain-containing protein [Brevundimonas sp.]
MRFMIVCLTAALAGAALAAPPVRANEAPQAASEPSARQLALTRRYIDLTMTDQFDSAIRQMIVDLAARDPDVRDFPEEDRRFLVDLTGELTTDMIPRMIDAMVPVYARTFTEAELEALIEFYDTEVGRSILEKTMVAMPEANRAAMTVLPQLMDKMAARICQHYGCEAGELDDLQRLMRGEVSISPTPK